MKINILSILLFTGLVIFTISNQVSIRNGNVFLTVLSQTGEQQKLKININSVAKSQLQLIQSSKINIEAKIQFNISTFQPEFISFRLKHGQYENLTEPVVAVYNPSQQTYTANIDIGDPKQIKAYSGVYKLELIISDDNLVSNVRNNIANCRVTFRKSSTDIPQSQLAYTPLKLIESSPPASRQDPPSLFTGFVVILIIVQFLLFLVGLKYLKVNLNLFPSNLKGSVCNSLFIILMVGILGILFKFWINWNFITTIQCLFVIILPTIFVSNYALVHIKKQ